MRQSHNHIAITHEFLLSQIEYYPITGIFLRRSNGFVLASVGSCGYIRISVGGKQYTAHRLAWLYVHGEWPKAQLDHIDGDPTNNQISNLREATHSQNRVNASAYSLSKTGIRGVHFHHGTKRFRVQLMRDGRSYHGGYFLRVEAAEAAAHNLAKKLHGEFACTDRRRIPLRKRYPDNGAIRERERSTAGIIGYRRI